MKGEWDMKKFINEFKEFAIRGNVIDLAVGVIIGTAFSSITNSLVNDIVMPFVGMFLNGTDFSSWVVTLPSLFVGGDTIELKIGVFINAVINFFILALVVFMFVKAINKMKKKHEVPEPEHAPSREELLLTEIRDILKNK